MIFKINIVFKCLINDESIRIIELKLRCKNPLSLLLAFFKTTTLCCRSEDEVSVLAREVYNTLSSCDQTTPLRDTFNSSNTSNTSRYVVEPGFIEY